MKTIGLSVLCCFLAVGSAVSQNGSDAVITEALKPSSLETNLQRLTDTIGGRVPGTPAMQRAVAWGTEAFKAAGADSVHSENFTIPTSWAEGATHMAVVAPERFSVRAISIGWAPAITPQQHVRLVDVGDGTAEDFAKVKNVSGAILLVHSEEMKTWEDLFAEYLKAPAVIDLAVKARALAIAFQSTRPHDLMYRHTNTDDGRIDRLPMVLVAREDAARMARLITSGQNLYADLAIPNHIGGPIQTSNVIAELRGSEKPDEFVILGAHLDSWELGTGALDNGCNAALVIDALRAIKASGQHPKRSIRFILFSGEEQGLLGSHAYALAHRNELDKAAGVVVIDSGTGKVTGFATGGRKDVLPAVSKLVAPLQQFDANGLTTDAEWGTDHFDFMLQGVPTFVANQEESNYLINYHAESDTFDKVDMGQLKKHVAETAALAFALADDPERVGPRLHHDQIEETMRETHLDQLMKTFGMWDAWQQGKMGRPD
jgi:hypothetical protein